jgi:hypothetical protein
LPVAAGISQLFFNDGIPVKGGRITPKLHVLMLTVALPAFLLRYQTTKKEVATKLEQRLEQSE